MKTKAELEEEIAYLKERVAALEGAITAYRFTLERAYPLAPSYKFDTWPGLGQMQWYPTTTPEPFPYVTTNNSK